MEAQAERLGSDELALLCLALEAASRRWSEWAECAINEDVAAQFRVQAAEAETLQAMLGGASCVDVYPA